MTNSKRSAHNHDAAAVECKLLAKIRNFLQQRRRQLLRCMSPLLAQSGHSLRCNAMSAFGGNKADIPYGRIAYEIDRPQPGGGSNKICTKHSRCGFRLEVGGCCGGVP